ncbi:hypothetical protein [Stomatobaculum longum]|nr:hypothetical protein [Stomatobaculum longum]
MMKSLVKNFKIPIIIACLQWGILLAINADSAFFIYIRNAQGNVEASSVLLRWVTQLLAFVLLCVIWSSVWFLTAKLRAGDRAYKRWFRFFGIYFGIQMLLMLILWPGTWAWDDIMTLEFSVRCYGIFAWQHVFTSIFQMVALHIFPFPAGIIIIQQLLIAVCVATSLFWMEQSLGLKRLKNGALDIAIKLFPFLMPPVLMYQFSGYRNGPLVYLELLLVVLLLKEIKERKQRCISIWYYVFLVSLLAVVAEWRSENIIYIAIGVCVFALRNYKKTYYKISIVVLALALFMAAHQVQKYIMGEDDMYAIASTMRPAVELLRRADSQKDEQEIADMSEVVDKNYVDNHPGMHGELVFGEAGIRDKHISHQAYQKYMKGLTNLVIKYPGVFLHERVSLFLAAMGIKGDGLQMTNVQHTVHLMDTSYANTHLDFMRNSGWLMVKPFAPELRKSLILALGQQTYDGKESPLFYVFWNGLIPIGFLIVALFYGLRKKNRLLFGLVAVLLIKMFAVILAEPSSWIMYYLSQYMAGYVLLSYWMIMILSRTRIQKGA